MKAKIVLVEEVCVAFLPRKQLNLTRPIAAENHNGPPWPMPHWCITVESERELWEFTKFE